MRLAVDGSSIIWTCLKAGIDKEGSKIEHEGRLVQVNTAAHGYENAVNHLVGTLKNWRLAPKDMIFVFEGMNSKGPRIAIDSAYKSKRGSHPPEAYVEFTALRDKLTKVFGGLGTLCIEQDEVEGDDVLGFLAQNTESDLVIDSYDNDLSVLCGTNSYGAQVHVNINGVLDSNKYGDFPTKYIDVYKALVGDTSDSITGIRGFGEKAFGKFYAKFGSHGLAELQRLARLGSLDELIPEMDADPLIAQIVEGADQFLNSYKLAKIYPEWVNTLRNPLRYTPGLVKGEVTDERLVQWAPWERLVTATSWDKFLKQELPKMLATPEIALDIETSTPDESDEWLAAQDSPEGVDVMGSELTGMSLTYGDNLQYTVYISVDHADTHNVSKDDLRGLIETLVANETIFVIQNVSFEHAVLFNEWGAHWKDNGCEGLLPRCLDTKLEASYVNENEPLGLKKLSKMYFNYDQVEYKAVTTIDGVRYKMRELSARHVKSYGCDDTITCSALHTFFKTVMELEHSWGVYLDVEIDAMYLHSQSYIHGTKEDVAKVKELEAADAATEQAASQVLNAYLISKGWEGSLPPTLSEDNCSPAAIKAAFLAAYGVELKTSDRKMEKLVAAMKAQDGQLLAGFVETSDWVGASRFIASRFTAKPEFNGGSTKQMQKLLYEVMGLPIRVYNKPTEIARRQGATQGSPKTDALAIAYALAVDADGEQKEALQALKLIKMVETRKSLYYSTYPYFVHWKTGRVHSSHNQCATNTRRASSSGPNLQQIEKSGKIEGQKPKFREVIVPHKRGAVIVSMDFAAQELRVIADYSQDENMLACFVGDNLKDMHALTGLGIAARKRPEIAWSYEMFIEALHDESSSLYKFVKECRTLGKKVNFTTEYGARAPKLAMTMLVSEAEAQSYIDAKEESFPRASEWKQEVIAEARMLGYVTTKLGARRHLASAFKSRDKYEASKAERQAVNFKIQGSSGEMTKKAEGRMWKARLESRFDCQIIAPIHDEVVASCAVSDLYGFIPAMHACMVAQYADMRVPVRSSISLGPDFCNQHEMGEEPTREAITQAIEVWGLTEFIKPEKETV